MVFWKPPYLKLFASRALPVIIFQNQRLLEMGGEPVYLLRREWIGTETRGEWLCKRFTSMDLTLEGAVAIWVLWDVGVNREDEYPDLRSIEVIINQTKAINVYAEEFLLDNFCFYIRHIRDNISENIKHRVLLVFRKEVKEAQDYKFECRFRTIHPDFDEITNQVFMTSTSLGAKYGWRQFRWKGVKYRNRIIPDGFLMAFPDIRRDLSLGHIGWTPESSYDGWTTAPPFAPKLQEHDVILRLNGLRYEIRDMTENLVDGILVQQEFRISEVSPANPVYDVEVDTIKGTYGGFPETKIYSGA